MAEQLTLVEQADRLMEGQALYVHEWWTAARELERLAGVARKYRAANMGVKHLRLQVERLLDDQQDAAGGGSRVALAIHEFVEGGVAAVRVSYGDAAATAHRVYRVGLLYPKV